MGTSAAGSGGHQSAATSSGVTTSLSLKATAEGDAVDVVYNVVNSTSKSVWLLDGMLVRADGRWVSAQGRPSITRGADGNTHLTFGFLATESQLPYVEQGVASEMPPSATELHAKAHLTRTIRLEVPLLAWHPYLRLAPLDPIAKVVLAIGYVSKPHQWMASGVVPTDVRVPPLEWVKRTQRWAMSDPQAVP